MGHTETASTTQKEFDVTEPIRLLPSPKVLPGVATEPMQRVTRVSVGAEHGMLLTDAGMVFTWGDNRHGQLGRSPCYKEENGRPFPVLDLLDTEITQIASGMHHCLALTSYG